MITQHAHDADHAYLTDEDLFHQAGKVRPSEKPQSCNYCDEPATKSFLWAEGKAYIPACDRHHGRTIAHIRKEYDDEPDAVHTVRKSAGRTVRYIRNPESSRAHGDFGEQYAQHIEPAGRYLTERSGDHVPDGWESGEVHFRNPLHMDWGDDYRSGKNWKHELSNRFDGRTGHELSRAVADAGHDGIITSDKYGTNEIVDLTHLHKGSVRALSRKRFTPTKRIFGPTHGLDKRLFSADHLKHDVRNWVLETLHGFWDEMYGPKWPVWSRVYFAGSEASEWTSAELIGNNDFDVLIGVDYARLREAMDERGAGKLFAMMTDEQITAGMNVQLREGLIPRTDPSMIPIEGTPQGPFSVTWYVNQDSYDIRKIKPYAAYDVTRDRWAVRPPHLPEWSAKDLPKGFIDEAHAVEDYVRAVLKLPEPYRSQQGDALWRHLHSDRSRAFGPEGEGWYDPGNALEKWLDQAGLWERLADVHFDCVANPHKLLAPVNWSNDPRAVG